MANTFKISFLGFGLALAAQSAQGKINFTYSLDLKENAKTIKNTIQTMDSQEFRKDISDKSAVRRLGNVFKTFNNLNDKEKKEFEKYCDTVATYLNKYAKKKNGRRVFNKSTGYYKNFLHSFASSQNADASLLKNALTSLSNDNNEQNFLLSFADVVQNDLSQSSQKFLQDMHSKFLNINYLPGDYSAEDNTYTLSLETIADPNDEDEKLLPKIVLSAKNKKFLPEMTTITIAENLQSVVHAYGKDTSTTKNGIPNYIYLSVDQNYDDGAKREFRIPYSVDNADIAAKVPVSCESKDDWNDRLEGNNASLKGPQLSTRLKNLQNLGCDIPSQFGQLIIKADRANVVSSLTKVVKEDSNWCTKTRKARGTIALFNGMLQLEQAPCSEICTTAYVLSNNNMGAVCPAIPIQVIYEDVYSNTSTTSPTKYLNLVQFTMGGGCGVVSVDPSNLPITTLAPINSSCFTGWIHSSKKAYLSPWGVEESNGLEYILDQTISGKTLKISGNILANNSALGGTFNLYNYSDNPSTPATIVYTGSVDDKGVITMNLPLSYNGSYTAFTPPTSAATGTANLVINDRSNNKSFTLLAGSTGISGTGTSNTNLSYNVAALLNMNLWAVATNIAINDSAVTAATTIPSSIIVTNGLGSTASTATSGGIILPLHGVFTPTTTIAAPITANTLTAQ